jgi:hypothetical protein
MERGEIGERYVKETMIALYDNCEKVDAKEGYDFDLFIDKIHVRLEVKTIQSFNAPFHITINEIAHAQIYKDYYYICFAIINQKTKKIRELRFLKNPIVSLDIEIQKKYKRESCEITPEKFMITPINGYIKDLPNKIIIGC